VFQKGDLVSCRTFSGELLGIVLEIHPLSGIWKDSSCSEPMYQVLTAYENPPKSKEIGMISMISRWKIWKEGGER